MLSEVSAVVEFEIGHDGVFVESGGVGSARGGEHEQMARRARQWCDSPIDGARRLTTWMHCRAGEPWAVSEQAQQQTDAWSTPPHRGVFQHEEGHWVREAVAWAHLDQRLRVVASLAG
jgi:hypothetical protein